MMIANRGKFFLQYLFLVCLMPIFVVGQESRPSGHVGEDTPYCKLAQQPERYNHRVLRIQAIYRSGGEIMSLYDAHCPSRESASWVDYADDLRQTTSPELLTRMNQLLKQNGRARITVRIEFYGPKPVAIPAGTPPALADVMRGTDSRWGHQNQFATRVRFLKILTVEPVPADVAWPN
jgi:hypothetical protein